MSDFFNGMTPLGKTLTKVGIVGFLAVTLGYGVIRFLDMHERFLGSVSDDVSEMSKATTKQTELMTEIVKFNARAEQFYASDAQLKEQLTEALQKNTKALEATMKDGT